LLLKGDAGTGETGGAEKDRARSRVSSAAGVSSHHSQKKKKKRRRKKKEEEEEEECFLCCTVSVFTLAQTESH
jgi:hypothetical protein